MIYEWDEAKRQANLRKHGLDFVRAAWVLESPIVQIKSSIRVNARGEREQRQQAFAYVFEQLMVLTVVFVPGHERCRIVSFRPAHRNERKAYHAWLEADRDDP